MLSACWIHACMYYVCRLKVRAGLPEEPQVCQWVNLSLLWNSSTGCWYAAYNNVTEYEKMANLVVKFIFLFCLLPRSAF